MVLDNENQRKLLLQILNSSQIGGTVEQVRITLKKIDGLINDIKTARLREEKKENFLESQ